MKDEIKHRLAKTILQFMNLYLLKNNNEKEGAINNDNLVLTNYNLPQIQNYSQNNINLDDI